MNIAFVNDNDLAGRRFNGHDLQVYLNSHGHKAVQFVMRKAGTDKNTIPIVQDENSLMLRERCMQFEENISMQSVIYPFGEVLAKKKEFKQADVVHYHLIFNHFMSLYSFKKLAQLKPSVWTLHDPWALTGHCVHPLDCKGWLTGCKDCPHLDRYSPLKEDHAAAIWNIKKDIYKDIDIDIVVSSQWMYDMVKKSPLTKHFERVHLIPFGINKEVFRRRSRDSIRRRLGLNRDDFVIMFRQSSSEFKGLKYIKRALSKLSKGGSIVLLTVGEVGLLDKYKKEYRIIEYEWVDDNNLLVDLYSAADLFLMPSVAESFGLMAVEAMSCSLPVVVLEGTALPSVTFAPNCGLSLKKGDTGGLVETIERLRMSPEERDRRGQKGRRIVEEYYDINIYNTRLINLYRSVIKESKNERRQQRE